MKHTVPAAIATTALAAAALAGCSYVNPITTHENYAASDGTQVIAGDVEALNLIVIAEAVDSPATMIGTLVNSGDEDIDLVVTFDNATTTQLSVAAGETIKLSPEDGDTEVSGTAPAQPGLLATATFDVVGGQSYSKDVPILDGTLPEYQELVDSIG